MFRFVALVVVLLLAGGVWFVLTAEPTADVDVDAVGVIVPDGGRVVTGADAGASREAGLEEKLVVPGVVGEDEASSGQATPGEARAVVRGRVVFEQTEAPVAGARVVAHLEGVAPGDGPSATCGVDGRFALAIATPATLRALEVVADEGHAQRHVGRNDELRADDEITVDIRVASTIVIAGTVVDLDGEAVPDATVHGWSVEPIVLDLGRIADAGVTATTDELGRFTITGLASTFTLLADADGLVAHARAYSIPSLTRRQIDDLVLTVSPARDIEGRVIDAGGRGIAGADVRAVLPGNGEITDVAGVMRISPAAVDATTDAEGHFTLAGLASRELHISVDAPAHPPWQGRHAPGQPGMLIRLDAGGRVSGRVLTDQGLPAAGAVVRFAPNAFERGRTLRSTETDVDGRFDLLGLPETAKGVLDVLAADQAVHVLQPIRVSQLQDTPPVEIMLERGQRIAGIVVGVDGRPIRGAGVHVSGERLVDVGNVTMFPVPTWENRLNRSSDLTDADGRFELKQLYSGTFTLRVEHPDEDGLELTLPVIAGSTDLRVVLDPDALRGVVLRGRVTDAQTGLAVRDFYVAPMRDSGNGGFAGQNTSFEDADGRFVIQGLEPGKLLVTIRAEGYADFSVPATDYDLGEHVLDVALFPTRELSLRIIDTSGAPLVSQLMFEGSSGEFISVETAPYTKSSRLATDANGFAIARGLPAKEVTVIVETPGYLDPTRRLFDLSTPFVGVQDIVIPDPVTQDILVLVFKPGPNANGAPALLPATASTNDRLVEIAGMLRDGELTSVAPTVEVSLRRADGTWLGATELDTGATTAVFSDAALVDHPIAVQIEVPVGPVKVEISTPENSSTVAPWSANLEDVDTLGLLVIVL